MEFKRARLDDIRVDDDARIVEGYASTFGGVDDCGDTVAPGAYRKSLKNIKARSGLPMLYEHDGGRLIGRWTDLAEDERGLHVRGHLTPGHSVASDVYASLKAGHIDGLSIGFRVPPGGAVERGDGGRTLRHIDLFEISIVSHPADRAARTLFVKSDFESMSVRDLERFLVRDAGMPASTAKALIAGGYKSLSATRDAGERPKPESVKAALLDAIRSTRG